MQRAAHACVGVVGARAPLRCLVSMGWPFYPHTCNPNIRTTASQPASQPSNVREKKGSSLPFVG